jgi:hypothetical protein
MSWMPRLKRRNWEGYALFAKIFCNYARARPALHKRNEKKAKQQEKHRPLYTMTIMLSCPQVIHRKNRTKTLQFELCTDKCGQLWKSACGQRP